MRIWLRFSCFPLLLQPLHRHLGHFLTPGRLMHRLSQWAVREIAGEQVVDPPFGYLNILVLLFASDSMPLVLQCREQRRAYSRERIENPVAIVRQGQHTTIDQLYGELAGVDRLLRVIGFNVRDVPKQSLPVFDDYLPLIGGVLTERITGRLAALLTFEMSFPGI